MIYHYGIYISADQIKQALGLPAHVEAEFEGLVTQVNVRFRSSEPFRVANVEAEAIESMPWSPFDASLARVLELADATNQA